MRFMDMCLGEALTAARDDMAVVVKTNMRDGFRGGLDLDECLEVARRHRAERSPRAGAQRRIRQPDADVRDARLDALRLDDILHEATVAQGRSAGRRALDDPRTSRSAKPISSTTRCDSARR